MRVEIIQNHFDFYNVFIKEFSYVKDEKKNLMYYSCLSLANGRKF